MNNLQKITILIPCYNEERGVGKVIDAIPFVYLKKMGYSTEVIVIDNNSSDKTAEVAKTKNAFVVHEPNKGKGNAIKAGFAAINDDTSFIVMLDGDNTYKAHEIPRLIEPLMNNFCDVVVGSRLSGKIRKNSLKLQNRIANWGYTFLVRHFYGANTTDVLSGFFAWKREVITKLRPHLESEGFEIEMEMIIKMTKLRFDLFSVPITYDERVGQTKIDSITDGIKVLHMFFKNLNWRPRKISTKNVSIIQVSNAQ